MRLRTWKQPMGYGDVVKKLCEKLKRDCNIDCDPHSFRRTYAGSQMKSNLSYMSWTMKRNGLYADAVGSMTPASELIKKKYKLEAYYIDPFFTEIAEQEV